MNIIITGASRGIGYDTALALAKEHHVIAISRNQAKLDALVDNAFKLYQKKSITPLALDLNNLKKEDLSPIFNQFNQIDGLINNAGILINKPFEMLTSEDWQLLFTTNVFAVANLITLCVPLLVKSKHGHIVNIGSMGGFQGSSKFPGLSAYSASKAALANLSECLAEEFKDKNIAVNCLALGAVQTEMLAEAFPGYEAPVTSKEMANYIANFVLHGHKIQNGKVIALSVSTP